MAEDCSVAACDRPAYNKSRGLCVMHYTRWKRHGDPLVVFPSKRPRTPVRAKSCEVCGKQLVRHEREGPAHWSRRRTCSNTCGRELFVRNKYAGDPRVPGRRRVLARSCDECRHMLPPSSFPGVAGWICNQCYKSMLSDEQRSRYYERVARRYRQDQNETLTGAVNWGKQWTGAEMEIVATRTDLTLKELAEMLGRTLAAVAGARHKVAHDPKWIRVAGIESGARA